MTNEDVLYLVRRCKLNKGVELIPDNAYLFNRKFWHRIRGKILPYREYEEIIVLVKDGIKVGGIYRMSSYDIHVVMKKKYEGQGILSSFLKTGIINEIWPENKSVKLCDVHTRAEYEKKKYLAKLCHMEIKNADEIEKYLSCFKE